MQADRLTQYVIKMGKTTKVPTLEKKRSSEERLGPAKNKQIKKLHKEKGLVWVLFYILLRLNMGFNRQEIIRT